MEPFGDPTAARDVSLLPVQHPPRKETMSDTSLTKCKHCGLALKGEPNNWLHAEGKQRGKQRCAVEPHGFNGEAPGEDCSHICLGSRPMLPEGSGIPNEPFFIYPAEG